MTSKTVAQVPLATAAWQYGTGALRQRKTGDLHLGYMGDGYPLGVHDDRHVALTAGTRGGKGVSVIIPNLIMYPGSVVVIDPKGENALVTARARGHGSEICKGKEQKVVVLDPFEAVRRPGDDFSSLRGSFNPLDLVSADRPSSVDDAARIADAIIVSESTQDPYWEESARSLIKAVILYVMSSSDYRPMHER